MKFNLLNVLKKNEIKSALVSATALITGNFASTIIGLICTLVQGRYVTPEMLGYYKQFTILSGYLFIFHLGTYQALERLIPYFYGKEEEEKARQYTSVAYSWICICSIVITAIFFVLCIRSLFIQDYKAAICWLSQLLISVHTLVSGVLASTYRSLKDFEKLARANMIGAFATLLSIPFFFITPFWGLILKSVLNTVSIVPLLYNCPIKVRPKFVLTSFRDLVRQGLPMFSASYITNTGLDTLRNTLVLIFLSKEGLGLWNFAHMFYTMIIVIPNSLVAVINPRIMRDYGQNGSLKYLVKKYRLAAVGLVILMCVCAVLGAIALEILVPIVLPNYIRSLPIMIALLPCFVLKTLDIYYTMLLAVNDMKGINVISVTATALQLLLILVLHRYSQSMYIFAIALFSGMLAKVVFVWIRLAWIDRKEQEKQNSDTFIKI